MFDNVNYLDVARGRYTDQFKESTNFDYLMIIWLSGFQEIQDTALSMLSMNDIDKAYGYQLDVIGDIIGQPRTLENIDATGFFGFEGDSSAAGFGSISNQQGGLYISLSQKGDGGAFTLPDVSYRAFLKAKIIKNNSGGTAEDIITATQSVFNATAVELLEDPDESGVISLYIGRPWNDESFSVFPGLDETAVAERLLPIPAGVRVDYVDEGFNELFNAVDNWTQASDVLYYTVNTSVPQFNI